MPSVGIPTAASTTKPVPKRPTVLPCSSGGRRGFARAARGVFAWLRSRHRPKGLPLSRFRACGTGPWRPRNPAWHQTLFRRWRATKGHPQREHTLKNNQCDCREQATCHTSPQTRSETPATAMKTKQTPSALRAGAWVLGCTLLVLILADIPQRISCEGSVADL
jgi:hypothetical protein